MARQDYYELPIKTIREIISNAVCHRSYLTPGKIQVALFDDRLEVTSPGMLDSEITIEKMKTGLSKIRNKGIAAAFSYMNVVEAWGSGIPKMFREAKEYRLREPALIDMGSDFRINLYRKAADVDANGVINPKDSSNNATNSATDATNSLTEDEKKVIEAIRTKSDATQKEMQAMTGITLGTIKRILPRLQAKGLIERIGNRRFGKWQINDLLS